MSQRTDLHDLLKAIIGSGEVYFQPPPSLQMSYPCIRYERSNADTKFADNKPYMYKQRYTLQVIDADPDSDIISKVAELPQCTFDRHYAADDLNHDVFNIYF